VIASPSLLSSTTIGEDIHIWIHHHRTEASEMLFGFSSLGERALFRELIKVSGVGGKTAINMLALGEDELLRAIQLEDDKVLSSVPGIGKKTAQKIIVELKGSIDFTKKSGAPTHATPGDTMLISSLVSMGYDKKRVEAVVSHIDTHLSLQERTVSAIRELAKH